MGTGESTKGGLWRRTTVAVEVVRLGWRGVYAVVDLGLRRTCGRGSSSLSAQHGDKGRVRRVYGRVGDVGSHAARPRHRRDRASLTSAWVLFFFFLRSQPSWPCFLLLCE